MLVFLLLAGCSTSLAQLTPTSEVLPPTPTHTPPLPTLTPVIPTTTPTVIPVPRLTEYTLETDFDVSTQRITVHETILFTNNSQSTIQNLALMVEANLFPDCFHLTQLSWSDKILINNYQLSSNVLTIPLLESLPPTADIKIVIDYYLNIPYTQDYSSRPVPFGYTKRQSNLIDWYPFLPPYDNELGWVANPPGFYGEHDVYETANYSVVINTINAPANLVIAASSLPDVNGNTYRYIHEKARNFVWSASALYEISEIQVGDTLIRNYSFPFNPAANQQALKDTAAALELANRLFTPYPRKLLSVVEADFLDGMEYDGLFFLSRGFYNNDIIPPRAYITIIAAHETAHQWFYASIGSDQAKEPWLDESLCTYFERIFYENFYPNDLDWWWTTRILYFNPGGYINLPLYDYPGYTSYRNSVYLNGAIFIEQLRQQIGDEIFFAFLKDYTTTFSGKQVNSQDFFDLLANHTDQDLGPLLARYFSQQE